MLEKYLLGSHSPAKCARTLSNWMTNGMETGMLEHYGERLNRGPVIQSREVLQGFGPFERGEQQSKKSSPEVDVHLCGQNTG